MCLSKIDIVHKEPTNGTDIYIGYKFFKITKYKRIVGIIFNSNYNYPKQKWIKSNNIEIKVYSGRRNSYPSGFHIFRSKKQALNSWVNNDFSTLFEIEYRKIVAEGSEETMHTKNFLHVDVAKEIKIVRQIKQESKNVRTFKIIKK